MFNSVKILIVFVSIFGGTAKALECPKSLEVAISGMTFTDPGSAYKFANALKPTPEKSVRYHVAIEEHIMGQAREVIKEPFKLFEVTNTKCEYVGEKDRRLSASIYREVQYIEPLIDGHPEQGEESWRLVIRIPIYLSRVGRELAHRDLYRNGFMNFYIWLQESSDGLQAAAYDDIAAMLKYQVQADYYHRLFFFPLGISSLDEVQVSTEGLMATDTQSVATATASASQ